MKRYYTIIWIGAMYCLMQAGQMCAQSPTQDSLQKRLPTDQGAVRAATLYALSSEVLSADADKALGYAEQGLAVAKRLADSSAIAIGWQRVGAAQLRKGMAPQAIVLFDSVHVYWRKHPTDRLGSLYLNLGEAHSNTGAYKTAIEWYELARSFAIANKRKEQEIQARLYAGLNHNYLGDYATAVTQLQTAAKMAQDAGNTNQYDQAQFNLALVKLNQGDFQAAAKVYEDLRVRMEATKNVVRLPTLLNNLAICYRNMGDDAKALNTAYEALRIGEQVGQLRPQAISYNEIGQILLEQEQFADAKANLEKSGALRKKIGDVRGEGNTWLSMGSLYIKQGSLPEAKNSLDIAEVLFRKINFARGLNTIYQRYGGLFAKLGQYDSAAYYFKLAYTDATIRNEPINAADSKLGLAQVHNKKNEFAAARDSAISVLHLNAQTVHSAAIESDAHEVLTAAYAGLGNYATAYNSMHRHKSLHDSLNNISNVRRVAFIEKQNTLARKQIELDLLTRQRQIQQLELEKQQAELQGKTAEAEAKRKQIELLKQEAVVKELALAKSESERAERAQQVALLQAEKELENAETNRRRAVTLGLASVLVLVIVGLLLQYRAYYQKQKANVLLAKQKGEIEQQKHSLEEQAEELHQANHELEATLDSLKKTQRQLVNAEKIAGLAQLMANIAHEVNSPIGAIKASVQSSMRMYLEVSEHAVPFMRELDENAFARAKVITQEGIFAAQHSLTTREERAIRDKLQKTLEAKRLPSDDMFVRNLIYAGVHDRPERYADLLSRPDAETLVQHLANWVQLGVIQMQITQATDRTARVVGLLKAYAPRLNGEAKTSVLLHELLEPVLAQHSTAIRQGIALERSFLCSATVPVFPDLIKQVWNNLLHNAILAVQGQPNPMVKVETLQENDHALLRVTDSGPGIHPEILPNIFEPFFTTRPQGQGSGLGLGVCKLIVEQHGGDIGVTSVPGQTVFTVQLPMAASV